MNADDLIELKAPFKKALSEIGYKRFEKHLAKCFRNMPTIEARKEIIRFGNEIAQKEFFLNIANGGGK